MSSGVMGPLEKWCQLQDWERGSFWMQSLQMGHLLAPTSHRQLACVPRALSSILLRGRRPWHGQLVLAGAGQVSLLHR